MIETKASNEIGSTEVKEKARAAVVYCNAVTDWNSVNSGKPWRYALISHDEVRLNSSFMGLVSNQVSYKQLEIDDMFTNE
jgi:type III restriction enzyme